MQVKLISPPPDHFEGVQLSVCGAPLAVTNLLRQMVRITLCVYGLVSDIFRDSA